MLLYSHTHTHKKYYSETINQNVYTVTLLLSLYDYIYTKSTYYSLSFSKLITHENLLSK